MGLWDSLRISSSALAAQRLRMDTVANNVANMNTTHGPDGGPYRRQTVLFAPQQTTPVFGDFLGRASAQQPGAGVQVTRIVQDNTPPRRVYDPGNPDADTQGYVLLPNIDVVTEMTDLVGAQRAYQAAVTVLNATKALATSALNIGRG
jgi:flagellar basal-body rod protein FlgC